MTPEIVVSNSVNYTQPDSDPETNHPRRMKQIDAPNSNRIPLPIDEFARVLGGGVVPGSVVLIGGDPGIGKSTLMLQLAAAMAAGSDTVLYVSGEESAHQIKMRAGRIQGGNIEAMNELYLVTENNLEQIMAHIQALQARIVIIDSMPLALTRAVRGVP